MKKKKTRNTQCIACNPDILKIITGKRRESFFRRSTTSTDKGLKQLRSFLPFKIRYLHGVSILFPSTTRKKIKEYKLCLEISFSVPFKKKHNYKAGKLQFANNNK